jgi:hypothetical protein
MRQRSILIFALVVAAVVALTTPVLAGPVIVALESSPIDVQAGAPFTVGFTVISHGSSDGLEPIAGLTPHVITTNTAGQRVDVIAQPEGVPGHYVASLIPLSWGSGSGSSIRLVKMGRVRGWRRSRCVQLVLQPHRLACTSSNQSPSGGLARHC